MKSQSFFLFLWELAKIAALALVIVLPIRYFIAQPFFVKGASMEPSFEDGDYLIIDEISYRFKKPVRGEVIVFRFPEDPKQYFIKRVVALPGETVPAGFVIDESGYLASAQITEGNLKIKLKEDEYFVLGDNRLHSSDSRSWGALERRLIIGKTFIRVWPFDKAKYFTPVPYPLPAN
ncbi:MAG: signal peptidase I [Parcubacteria group bacterium]|nr:signal peptidase I [Parcubacteria group bacterium]